MMKIRILAIFLTLGFIGAINADKKCENDAKNAFNTQKKECKSKKGKERGTCMNAASKTMNEAKKACKSGDKDMKNKKDKKAKDEAKDEDKDDDKDEM